MEIEDAKQADSDAAVAKEHRKHELMALTGIDFDKEPELDMQMPGEEGDKKKDTKTKKKKKEVEEDPEEVKRQLDAKLKEEEIVKFGVSQNQIHIFFHNSSQSDSFFFLSEFFGFLFFKTWMNG